MIMLSNENFEGEMKMKINIAELPSKMSDKIMEILWWFFKPLLKMLLAFFDGSINDKYLLCRICL